MTTTTRGSGTVDGTADGRGDHGADPWWGGVDDEAPTADGAEGALLGAAVRAQLAADSDDSARSALGTAVADGAEVALVTARSVGVRVARMALAPLAWLVRRLARSPRMRRLAVRLAVVTAVLCVIAGSVGVILLNNVVIGRSAELGELDSARRELRRDNAVLGAEAARRSAPPLIMRRARTELQMTQSDEMPRFIWLDPGSRTLTALQRRRVAARAAAVQARQVAAARVAAAELAASSAPATPTTEPEATP